MTADEMRALANAGVTTKQAAKMAGMSYYQFRTFRWLYSDIKWSVTPARLAGLAAGRTPERYRKAT